MEYGDDSNGQLVSAGAKVFTDGSNPFAVKAEFESDGKWILTHEEETAYRNNTLVAEVKRENNLHGNHKTFARIP